MAVALLGLAACTPGGVSSSGTAASSAPVGASEAATPTATPAATPTPSPSPTRTAAPAKVSAGTLTDTLSTSVWGTGPAEVTYAGKGDFGVVAQLGCSSCRGAVTLTQDGRMTPYARTTAPLREAYLVRVTRDEPARQTLRLDAAGRRKLTSGAGTTRLAALTATVVRARERAARD